MRRHPDRLAVRDDPEWSDGRVERDLRDDAVGEWRHPWRGRRACSPRGWERRETPSRSRTSRWRPGPPSLERPAPTRTQRPRSRPPRRMWRIAAGSPKESNFVGPSQQPLDHGPSRRACRVRCRASVMSEETSGKESQVAARWATLLPVSPFLPVGTAMSSSASLGRSRSGWTIGRSRWAARSRARCSPT